MPAVCCAVVAAACWSLGAGSGRDRPSIRPGAGTFTGGPEGWQITDASCTVALLCTAEGGYDGTDGNPPGSWRRTRTIAAQPGDSCSNRRSRWNRRISRSPTRRRATLHLDRQFVPGSLVNLAPEATYTVDAARPHGGDQNDVRSKRPSAAPPRLHRQRPARRSVKAGHTYAISITTRRSARPSPGPVLLGGATSAPLRQRLADRSRRRRRWRRRRQRRRRRPQRPAGCIDA